VTLDPRYLKDCVSNTPENGDDTGAGAGLNPSPASRPDSRASNKSKDKKQKAKGGEEAPGEALGGGAAESAMPEIEFCLALNGEPFPDPNIAVEEAPVEEATSPKKKTKKK